MGRADREQRRLSYGRAIAERLIRRHGSPAAALKAYETWSAASIRRSIKATEFEWDAATGVADELRRRVAGDER